MAITFNSKKQIKGNYYTNKNDNKRKINHNELISKVKNNNIFKNLKFQKDFFNTISLKISYGIILAIFIFLLICYIIYMSYNYAISSDYFKIDLIKFNNNEILSNEELLEITKLELGINILNYNINEIKLKLLENNWIENVTINRDLPNKFFIDIQEKKPIFWGIQDEKVYYLDKNLNIIESVNNEKFISLPTFYISSYNEMAIDKIDIFIDALNNANLPFKINEISWLSINTLYGYELYIENVNLKINVSIDNFEIAIQNLALALNDLKKRNEINKINNIIAMRDQVIIEKN